MSQWLTVHVVPKEFDVKVIRTTAKITSNPLSVHPTEGFLSPPLNGEFSVLKINRYILSVSLVSIIMLIGINVTENVKNTLQMIPLHSWNFRVKRNE